MRSLLDFFETSWNQNEEAHRKRVEAQRLEAELQRLRAELDAVLKKVEEAKIRAASKPLPCPALNGFLRLIIGAICWIPLSYILCLPIVAVVYILTANSNAAGSIGVAGFAIASVATWWTPEIIFAIKERFRICYIKKLANMQLELFGLQANRIRASIAATVQKRKN